MIVPNRVDLRGMPVWDRPMHVFDEVRRLPDGSSLTVITENEPRGLVAGLQSRNLMIQSRRFGEREWHVSVHRAGVLPGTPVEQALRNVAAFASLDDAARTRLARLATVHAGRRNQTVAPEDTDWPSIGIVLEGVLGLATGQQCARRRIFYELHPREIFGAAEFFDGGLTMGRTIVVSKTARYARIPRDEVRALCRQFPDIALGLGDVCAQHKRELIDALCDHGTMPILARVAQVLARYAPPAKGLAASASPLPTMTQSMIAASAGTVKEVAARAIAELEERGALKRERGHITMVDRQLLLDITKERE